MRLETLVLNNLKHSLSTSLKESSSTTFVLLLTGGTTINLPIAVGGFDGSVDWGDGTFENYTTSTVLGISHTYASSGTYRVNIYGKIPTIKPNYNALGFINFRNALREAHLGRNKWNPTGLIRAFLYCYDLNKFSWKADNDSHRITNCTGMFLGCVGLSQHGEDVNNQDRIDLTHFDSRNVTTWQSMFQLCGAVRVKIAHLNITSTTSMVRMFWRAANKDLYYNDALKAWAENIQYGLTPSNVTWNAGTGAKPPYFGYTAESEVLVIQYGQGYYPYKQQLASHGWTIQDGGPTNNV